MSEQRSAGKIAEDEFDSSDLASAAQIYT